MTKAKNKNILIIIFGLSGTGKNVAAEFLRDKYGFFHCDGDVYFTEVQKENHRKGIPTTVKQRDVQFKDLIKILQELENKHSKLVFTSWLPERYQKDFQKTFPHAKFILLTVPPEKIEERLTKRKGHYISKEYSLHITKQWGKPVVPHEIIENASNIDTFKRKIQIFIEKLLL